MGIQSTIITTLAIAATTALPAPAAGSPLLSGYGGPGAGEQQLVGAELIGGGGRSGTPPGAGSPRNSETQTQSSGVHAAPGAANGGRSSNGGSATGAGSVGRGHLGASSYGKGGEPAGETGHSARGAGSGGAAAGRLAAATSSSTLGLSSAQLLLIAIVAAALIFVALLTKSLARLQRTRKTADSGPMKTGELR